MRKFAATLLISALALGLVACKKEEPTATASTPDADAQQILEEGQPPPLPVEPPADAVIPVEVAANAFAIGSSLTDNKASAPKPVYATGDTIYASLPAGRYRSGSTVNVYWTYEDGSSHKDETKEISGQFVTFQFSAADGMKAGKYNVEIGVNDKPVGIVDFVVR